MTTSDSALHVVEHGAGLPLALLHGFGVDHRILERFVEEAVRDVPGVRRLHVDLPGHGRSSGDGVESAADVHDHVLSFVRSLGEPVALLGASFGAGVARAIVAAAPDLVRGVAFLAPMIHPDVVDRDLDPATPRIADRAWFDSLEPVDLRDSFAEVTAVPGPRTWQLFLDEVVPGLAAADAAAIERIGADYDFRTWPEDSVGAFDGPTLFLLGRQDAVVGWRDALRLLPHYPRADVVLLDDAGHNPHHERPDLVRAALRAWTRRVVAAG